MGAAPCFHSHDTLRVQRTGDDQQALIFLRVNIVRDHNEVVTIAEAFAQELDQSRFPRANRAPDADSERKVFLGAN
jgi:hypothetical protein